MDSTGRCSAFASFSPVCKEAWRRRSSLSTWANRTSPLAADTGGASILTARIRVRHGGQTMLVSLASSPSCSKNGVVAESPESGR